MDTATLQARLVEIIAEEEADPADWAKVERLCEILAKELDETGFDCPEIVAHYLSDPDIRVRDPKYGDNQREYIRLYINAGEYDDSVAIPWRGCLIFFVLIGAILFWLF